MFNERSEHNQNDVAIKRIFKMIKIIMKQEFSSQKENLFSPTSRPSSGV